MFCFVMLVGRVDRRRRRRDRTTMVGPRISAVRRGISMVFLSRVWHYDLSRVGGLVIAIDQGNIVSCACGRFRSVVGGWLGIGLLGEAAGLPNDGFNEEGSNKPTHEGPMAALI